MKKIFIFLMSLYYISYANQADAKFLVIDNNTYKQIEKLNILNGGIQKNIIVTSTKLSNKSLLKYYPSFFLYKGKKCTLVNNVVHNNVKVSKNMLQFYDKKDILKEIKKIKLLQLLNDSDDLNLNATKVSKNILKSIGLICENTLLLRGRYYAQDDFIDSIKISSIDTKNSTVIIEE